MIMWVLSEGPSRRNSGGKNVRNSARFLTTFDFDHEYLRNGWTLDIANIWKACDQLQPPPCWAKKAGELWSTNKKVGVLWCPFKSTV